MLGLTPLMPAYGRDYKSKKAAQADFDAGRDFVASDGRYIGKGDLARAGFHARQIEVRSADKRKVWMLDTTEAQP